MSATDTFRTDGVYTTLLSPGHDMTDRVYGLLEFARHMEREINALQDALKPFVGLSSSEETIQITVKTADIERARKLLP